MAAITVVLTATNLWSQDAGLVISGTAVSEAPNQQRFAVPAVNLTLTSVEDDTAEPQIASSDATGAFRFEGVTAGCYMITGASVGLTGSTDIFCVAAGEDALPVIIDMRPEVVVQSIEVTASALEIDTTETSTVSSVGEAALDNAPKASRSFEDVLRLLPGIVRGPSGEINSSGSRASQAGVRLNGADVTDPVTGSSEINLPADVVSRVEVLTNPYDAEYGDFVGAMSKVETKTSAMDEFKISLHNFNPRFRVRDGAIMGVESATPRLTLTGPIRKGRVAYTQSFEYQFVRQEQEDANLDPLARDVEREALSSFSQIDAVISDRNSLTGNFLIFPEKLNFFGLNAFNPQQSTPDLRRRGFLTTVRDVHQFESGSALISQVDIQDLGSDVLPRGLDAYVIGLERASGAFYHRQRRNSSRFGWSELFHFKPVQAWGNHQLKYGFSWSRERFESNLAFDPITWLGSNGDPVRRVEFTPNADVGATRMDGNLFMHDTWSITPSLTLDLGVRLERDSIVSTFNPAYRVGFAYSPGLSSKTVVRGGTGLFYASASPFIRTFSDWPGRTDTLFTPAGTPSSTFAFRNVLTDDLQNPKSRAWSLQIDREITQNFLLRVGYQQRQTTDNFVVQRLTTPATADTLLLSNRGKDSYREYQVTGRYRLFGDSQLTGSYVRSSAVGDLNDLGSLFGSVPAALVQPNERGPLAFDAPNRFVAWADIGLPLEVRVAPVIEMRQGFPYTSYSELREIIGGRNRAGRFPDFRTFDLQITKRFHLTLKGKTRNIRLGVRVFNVMNRFNPLDVQSNVGSPYFGTFYRGVKRRLRGVLEIEN